MDLTGSLTEKNLELAFATKVQGRNRSIYFAEAAERSCRGDVASLLRAIAQNETRDASEQFDLLTRTCDTRSNLESILRERRDRQERLYPSYAKTAREEGFEEIAELFERLSVAEGRQWQELRTALESLTTGKPLQGLPVQYSATTMSCLVMPTQANQFGRMHGGEMVKLMDNAAGVAAVRHARNNVVTARIEEIDFFKPVNVGDLLLIDAALTFVARRSMEVRVQVTTEVLTTGDREKALTAYFTMVAYDEQNQPTEVPPLIIISEEEQRLFAEGRARYEARKRARQAT